MSLCIFCEIAKKKAPASIIYESETIICFLPKNMETYGHTIIAPKEHYFNIYDIPAETLSDLSVVAKNLSVHYRKTINATGINILHASGESGQQSVFHFHLHLFPRFDDDKIDAWPKLPKANFVHKEFLERAKVETSFDLPIAQDEFKYKFELLKDEIGHIQSSISAYDNILFIIKGWAITIFSGFVIFAIDKNKPVFLAFTAAAVILFWILDALFKSMQRVYIDRNNLIEGYLQSREFSNAIRFQIFGNFLSPNIGSSFRVKPMQKYINLWKAMFLMHNVLLYLPMLVILAGLAWFMP